MLNLARASLGMTLVAVFGTVTTVTWRLDGSKSALPWSSGVDDSRSIRRASFGTGFSASAG